MIHITDKAMKELCEKLAIDEKKITFLGGGREDSDGTVYTYLDGQKKKVLKILAIPETKKDSLKQLEVRIRYAGYLGEHGVKLAYPLYNQNGNLYEISQDNNHYYTAYVMDFYEGKNPESNEMTDEFVCQWGMLTGKMHAIAKSFGGFEEIHHFGHEYEVDYFYNWCKDAEVKNAWLQMKQELSKLPKGINDYGFIQNDNHQRNILRTDEGITLLDFDCAGLQFFIQEITTPAQGIMFDITGGMFTEVQEKERLKRFFDSFINGYEKQNHLEQMWYDKIPLFMNYRRMLLFTCMQDWLNTMPDIKNGFIRNIMNPQELW